MELAIDVGGLLKALTLLHTVAQRKGSMPILSHVLLQATQQHEGAGQLDLSATDLETGMRLCLPCQVKTAGGAAVPVRTLLDVVRSLPAAQVSLRCDEKGQLQVHSGRVRAQLLTLPQEEFPQVARPKDAVLRQVNVKQFVDMAQKTLYCTSTDENRFTLTGVCCESLDQEGPGLVLVATDGHRLSRVHRQSDCVDLSLQVPIILPRKGLTELLRLLQQEDPQEDTQFQLGLLQGQLVAVYGAALLTMRLVEGEFPDYQRVIPKLSDKIVRASRSDLLACLRRAAVLVSEKHAALRWDLSPGELCVHCYNPEAGEVSDQVAVEYDGPNLKIGLNARYALEAIHSLEDENVLIRFTDSASPVLFSGIEPQHHQCVVMPMDV